MPPSLTRHQRFTFFKKGRDAVAKILPRRRARAKASSTFSYYFHNTYSMRDIVYDVGDTTIGGTATGRSRIDQFGSLHISGSCDFYLRDAFTDPLSGSEIGMPFDLPFSTPCPIHDDWRGRISGVVRLESHETRFRK